MDAPIPSRELPVAARAPGKCVVFGEHAVVQGRPELLFALDLHVQVMIRPGAATQLNADRAAEQHNAYFAEGLRQFWSGRGAVDVRVSSRVPKSAGLGSSAAFCAALGAALGAATGGLTRRQLAERSFAMERGAQGVGSPGDTSAAVGGGFLSVNGRGGENLWELKDDDHAWTVRRVPDPNWVWVVANSGIPRNTGETVRNVRRRLEAPDGPALLDRFAQVATEGIDAVAAGDRVRVGQLLTENHRLLREVGVSHPRLEAMLDAVAPAAHGAKLTGAGAGGSIVALPIVGREMEAARRISRAGGVAYVVRVAAEGAALVEPPAGSTPPQA